MTAKPTSITMPMEMNARLYSRVLRVRGHSLLDTIRNLKFFSPTHGLAKSPWVKLYFLKAMITPIMGV